MYGIISVVVVVGNRPSREMMISALLKSLPLFRTVKCFMCATKPFLAWQSFLHAVHTNSEGGRGSSVCNVCNISLCWNTMIVMLITGFIAIVPVPCGSTSNLRMSALVQLVG